MAPVILNSTIESASLAASSRIPVDLAEVARTSGPSGFFGGESMGENAASRRWLYTDPYQHVLGLLAPWRLANMNLDVESTQSPRPR